jgi:hypothetical protein
MMPQAPTTAAARNATVNDGAAESSPPRIRKRSSSVAASPLALKSELVYSST